MDDHEVGRRIHRAIDPGAGFPSPMLWERAVSRLDEPVEPRRGPWRTFALAAVVLCAAAVAGILVLSRSAESRDQVPAGSGVRAAPGQAFAPWAQPTSTRPGTADYQFVSPTAGWLVEYVDGSAAHVLRTGDGGAHWTAAGDLTRVSPLSSLRFFDDHRGLVIARDMSALGLRVYSTADGGAHWQAADGAASIGTVRAAWFTTMTEGWLLAVPPGGSLGVYHTTDGGQRWELDGGLATAPLLAGLGQKGAIQFATSQDGWIFGFEVSSGQEVLLATHDGGRTWSTVVLPTPTGLNLTGKRLTGALPMMHGTDGLMVASLTSPQPRPSGLPADAGVGIAIQALYLYETRDGGRTWSYVRKLDGFGISFQDATHWRRFDGSGMRFSDDAGATWGAPRPLPQPAGWDVVRPSFLGSTGWLIIQHRVVIAPSRGPSPTQPPAQRYAVLVTTDGGVHWTEGQLPPA